MAANRPVFHECAFGLIWTSILKGDLARFALFAIRFIRHIDKNAVGINAIVKLRDLDILMNEAGPHRLRIAVTKGTDDTNAAGDDRPVGQASDRDSHRFPSVPRVAKCPAIRVVGQLIFKADGGTPGAGFGVPAQGIVVPIGIINRAGHRAGGANGCRAVVLDGHGES